jgi:hypothetical protein
MAFTYKDLLATNPCLDTCYLNQLQAFYRGSRAVRAELSNFIPQNISEPGERYVKRIEQAPYHNYLGPIIDKFAAMLLASPPSPQVVNEAGEQDAPEQYWLDWRQNVDGNGGDLTQFFREQFTDALMKKRAIWAVYSGPADDDLALEAPMANRAEWRKSGMDQIRIAELETQDCLDWEADDAGQLLWLIHHTKSRPRLTPGDKRDTIVETWRIFDRQQVQTYRIKYPEGKPPKATDAVPLVGTWTHGLDECPIVILEMPDGLWVADRVYDVQLEHFRVAAALSWALKQSCFAMAMFFLADSNKPPQLGSGVGLMLDKEDSVDWLAPPTSHFAVMQDEKVKLKDELYRIVHQMADASSNNSGTIGRSGVSKSADLFSTRTILESFSELVRSAIERTMVMASRLRGEDTKWAVAGLDQFDDMNLQEFMASLEGIASFGIPSQTFGEEVRKMLVNAILPNVDEATRGRIFDEISEGMAKLEAEKEEQKELDLQTKRALAESVNEESGNAHGSAGAGKNLPPQGKAPNAGGKGAGPGVPPPSRTNAGGRAPFGRGAQAAPPKGNGPGPVKAKDRSRA